MMFSFFITPPARWATSPIWGGVFPDLRFFSHFSVIKTFLRHDINAA